MKKITVLVCLLTAIVAMSKGQTDTKIVFAKNDNVLDVSELNASDVKEHVLGQDVALKLEKIRSVYTYIEAATPTSPTEKTIVVKPLIYNSIQKLNRDFKKKIKKGLVEKEEAAKQMITCLDVALCAYAEDTEAFESSLKSAKSIEDILAVYNSVELKSGY